MKCLFLYYEKDRKIKRKLDYIKTSLSFYEKIDFKSLKNKKDLEEEIKNLHSYDDLVFSGGDGSFNLTLNHLLKENINVKIGYIPTGTANDIAHNLKISRNIKKAVDIIKKREIESINVLENNDKYFMYALGIGSLTKVSYLASDKNKRIFGTFAYVFSGIKEIFRLKSINLNIKTEKEKLSYDTPLFLLLNSSYIGGKKVNFIKKEEGYLDLIIVKKFISNFISIFLTLFFGVRCRKTFYYDTFKVKEVFIKDPLESCIDGEKEIGIVNVKVSDKRIKIYTKRKSEK